VLAQGVCPRTFFSGPVCHRTLKLYYVMAGRTMITDIPVCC